MSVFSMMKRGRQAAKEQDQKEAEKEKEKPRTEYHHIPTHAASDALLGAPSGWKKEDAAKIREQNRRRRALHASGSASSSRTSMVNPFYASMSRTPSTRSLNNGSSGMGSNMASSSSSSSSSRNTAPFPRVSSNLSQVSYPTHAASQPAHASHSFTSMDAQLYRAPPSPKSISISSFPVPPTGPSRTDWATAPLPPLPPTAAAAPASPSHKGKDAVIYDSYEALEMRPLKKQPLEPLPSGSAGSAARAGMPSPTLPSRPQLQPLQQPTGTGTGAITPPSSALLTVGPPPTSTVSRTSSSGTLGSSNAPSSASNETSLSSAATSVELTDSQPQLKPKDSMHMMSLMPGGFPNEAASLATDAKLDVDKTGPWPIQATNNQTPVAV